MNGLQHIADAFSLAKAQQRPALMPYFTLGFPTSLASLEVIDAIRAAGADLIELGVPFSDPLADGPTIQRSSQIALENGITVQECLELVKILRGRGLTLPLLLMGYYNPILAYGPERFVVDACQVGIDGLIVPDLPLEEAAALEAACRQKGMALVYLVAPTTTDARLAQLTAHSSGFVYIVSLTGVTGARANLAVGLQEFLQRVRAVTDKPLAVGFGISTPEQAAWVGKLADGVIVGSAVIDAAGKAPDPGTSVRKFVAELSKALQNNG